MKPTTTTGVVPSTITYARAGLWLLPVHAVLLGLSTLTHQPDPETAFPDYARYVTTGVFLVSHLFASIVGAALGLIGVVAALAFLVRGPAVRAAVLGTVLTIGGSVLTTAVFGAAAFAQPAVGRAFLRGAPDAAAINADVYGTPLFATVGVGMLLLIAGGIAFGRAVARTGERVYWAGIGYAVFLPLFVVSLFLFPSAQPFAAAALAAAAAVIAVRLPNAVR
jgi:hypothetical protein